MIETAKKKAIAMWELLPKKVKGSLGIGFLLFFVWYVYSNWLNEYARARIFGGTITVQVPCGRVFKNGFWEDNDSVIVVESEYLGKEKQTYKRHWVRQVKRGIKLDGQVEVHECRKSK